MKSLLLVLWCVATAQAELRVPAFTAYLSPQEKGGSVSEKAGITGWRGAPVKVEWFGRLEKAGKIDCSLVLQPVPGTLRLTVAGQSHEVKVGAETTIHFGSYEIAQPGYQSFVLEALQSGPQPALDTLILDGPAVQDAHFNLLPRRNAASVHLMYTLPKEGALDAFYSECTAVEEPIHTFYMACGFQRGYFGMQINSPSERRIIFSVWDSGAGTHAARRDGVAAEDQTTLLRKGEGVEASVFGNEGTGGHSHLVYPWKTGVKQRFLLTARAGENGSAIYTGYWFHPEKKAWMVIASFRAPKASPVLSHFHSFCENFSGDNGERRRKALYGNQWVHLAGGDWKEVTEASFSHDGTGKEARLDRAMGVEDGRFFLATGGFVEGFTKFGTKFTRPSEGRPPADLDLAKLPQ